MLYEVNMNLYDLFHDMDMLDSDSFDVQLNLYMPHVEYDNLQFHVDDLLQHILDFDNSQMRFTKSGSFIHIFSNSDSIVLRPVQQICTLQKIGFFPNP